MPARWAQASIVLFWLVMTVMLVRKDLLPRMGYGELTYRSLVGERALEESTHWKIEWNGKPLGSSLTVVRPNSDGSCNLMNRTNLSSSVFEANTSSTQVILHSDIHVDPLGKLDRFSSSLSVEGTPLQLRLRGERRGSQLLLETEGLKFLPPEMTVDVDEEMMFLDVVAPMDRIPDLRVGKKWATRAINPVSLVFSTGSLFGSRTPQFEVTTHEVTGTDAISWDGRSWYCHVIEHVHSSGKSQTWVRIRDGQVLRHEAQVAGSVITLELDPAIAEY